MTATATAIDHVKTYYGKVLQRSQDLKTSACCSANGLPAAYRSWLQDIHPEILDRFYGCGSPLPPAMEGCTVLDLGCGTGRDVYLAARATGASGKVIGLDMTGEQLEVARRHLEYQMDRYGYASPNVVFLQGYIEDLGAVGIADASVDVVISNCVINLSPAKERVYAEILRVLKPGGEMYLSDVFADRRLDPVLMEDPVLLGECLAGAMYTEDFRRIMGKLGCPDIRIAAAATLRIEEEKIRTRLGFAKFFSHTVRAFKLDSLEDRCEEYGQVATYLGAIPGHPHAFPLDLHHVFETGRPMTVCGNTAAMLSETRYAKHFTVSGDRDRHYGLFSCTSATSAESAASAAPCC